MNDRIVSLLRTYVPKAWGIAVGALLVWLGQHAPWAVTLLDALGIDLNAPATVLAVVALTEAAWYYLLRRIEPHLPDWATRFLLGSASSPVYVKPGQVAAVAPQGSTITVDGELREG